MQKTPELVTRLGKDERRASLNDGVLKEISKDTGVVESKRKMIKRHQKGASNIPENSLKYEFSEDEEKLPLMDLASLLDEE